MARADDFRLPAPGVMVHLSPPLDPPILRGIKIHPDNPFRFDFILDKGDDVIASEAKQSQQEQLKTEATKLIKYFLASLTIPEKDLWVNLSPYEKDRIIPQSFGLTEMGRDLLAEDYMLKQITASLIYPEDQIGRKFWKRIYQEAEKRYGTTDIPVNTFNKVWIVPEKAVVYENTKAGTAYVVDAKLKVMLEQDYLSLEKHEGIQSEVSQGKETSQLGNQIVREIVIPELTKEVNEDKNFARLRQVYNSLILATWYKKKIKDSILEQVYVDKDKVAGVNISDPQEKEMIYQQYLRAFKKGVFNYIKQDLDPVTQETIPRKYFSGGIDWAMLGAPEETDLGLNGGTGIAITHVLGKTPIIDPNSEEIVQADTVPSYIGGNQENDKNVYPSPVNRIDEPSTEPSVGAERTGPGFMSQYQYSSPEFEPTPRVQENPNQNVFLDYMGRKTDKTPEERLVELDRYVAREHYRIYLKYGFISPQQNSEARTVQKIFDRLIDGYNRQADRKGLPHYGGKLFIIDSPSVNAFVFAEHQDVYIYAGLIRELAHYCQIKGISFTEDLIAAVLAHELTHVFQHSSFMGLNWEDVTSNKILLQEALELKRRAELHADEGSMKLLSSVDYSPESMVTVLDFLDAITQESTSEYLLNNHPHAKQRRANLEMQIEDDNRVYHGWQTHGARLDIDSFMRFNGRYLGSKATQVHSFVDVERAINEAKSMEELLGALQLYRYMGRGSFLIGRAKSKAARKAFAKYIYMNNVLDLLNGLIQHFSLKMGQGPTAMPIYDAEGLFVKRILANDIDQINGQEMEEKREKDLNKGVDDAFGDKVKNLFKNFGKTSVEPALKVKIYDLLEDIFKKALKDVQAIDESQEDGLGDYIANGPETCANWNDIIAEAARGDLGVLKDLRLRPYSIFRVYGKQGLDRILDSREFFHDYLGGLTENVDIGKARLVQSSFAFYAKDIRLQDISTIKSREELYFLLTIGFLKENGMTYYSELSTNDSSKQIREFVKTSLGRFSNLDQTDMELLTDYLSGKYLGQIELEQVREIFNRLDYHEGGGIFTDVFNKELNGDEWVAKFWPIRKLELRENEFNRETAKRYEIRNDAKEAAFWITKHLAVKPENIGQLRQVLEWFNPEFRYSIINEMLNIQNKYYTGNAITLQPDEWSTTIQGLIHPEDYFRTVLHAFANYEEKDARKLEALNQPRSIALLDWLIDHKPESFKKFSSDFLWLYIRLQGMAMEKKAREESKTVEEMMTTDYVYQVLSRLASVGLLELEDYQREDLTEGLTDIRKLKIEKSKADTSDKNKQLSPEELPLAFFGDAKWETSQIFCRRFFDFNDEQLKEISLRQWNLRRSLIIHRGRMQSDIPYDIFHVMLDGLILKKVAIKHGFLDEKINSSNLGNFWKGHFSGSFTNPLEAVTLVFNHDGYSYWTVFNKIENRLKSDEAMKAEDELRSFFNDLKDAGFMGHTDDGDGFFTNISELDPGIGVFPSFEKMMKDMQIPKPDKDKITDTNLRRSYLEALSQTVDIEGKKAAIFKKYDALVLHLLESDVPIRERISVLLRYLPVGNLFRDGYFDQWERKLVPEISPNWLERRVLERMNEGEKGRFDLFQQTVMMTPFQWQKVADGDFKMPQARAREVLDFYEAAIPYIFDPERQLRMGVTAMKILRSSFPNLSFNDELASIRKFFPVASDKRDQEINVLFDRHVVPDLENGISAELVEEALSLYKANQDMFYDEELTNANSFQSVMESLFASFSRADRIDMLFWMLNPQTQKPPRVIQEMDNKFNIEFKAMTEHITYMPEEYRLKMLQGLFLGENGIFVPHSAQDELEIDAFIDRIFLYFFPEGGRKAKGQLDKKTYDFLRDIFPIVLKAYTPARRTNVVLTLLKIHDKISSMSEGERLARLLSALGPVGVKVAQYLSENKNLIPSESLRSELASLKSEAPPISKMAVLEVLREAGFDLHNIKVGRRLGTASMKQVHEGWLRLTDGTWIEVVIKVLKPKAVRTTPYDLEAMRKVVDYLKEKKGIDAGDIVRTIEQWIAEEEDFRRETANMLKIKASLDRYYKMFPERGENRPIIVPKVYVGDQKTVMIEEKVRGLEVARLFKGVDIKKVENETRKQLRAKMKGFGFSEDDLDVIFSLSLADIITRLRGYFLFQLFQDGTFHADLHQGNEMVGPQNDFLIDMGLVRELNAEQIKAANNIMSGILLHDEDLVFDGIVKMHVYSKAVPEGQRESVRQKIVQTEPALKKDIRNIFKKGQGVKADVMEISSRVLKEQWGASSDDFNSFMKALTQAIWLFPTEGLGALDTLNAFAEALGLTPQQIRTVKRTEGLSILKKALYHSSLRIGRSSHHFLSAAVRPLVKRYGQLRKAQKNIRVAQEIQNNREEIMGHLDGMAEVLSHEKPATASRTITLSEDLRALEKLPVYNQLDPQQQEGVRQYMDLFRKVNRYVRNISGNDLTDSQKYFMKTMAEKEGLKDDLEIELVSRTLTSWFVKKYKPDNFVDLLSPVAPALRAWGELLTSTYLKDKALELATEDKKFKEVTPDEVLDRVYEEINKIRLSGYFITVSVDNTGVDMKIKYERQDNVALPQQFFSKDLRSYLAWGWKEGKITTFNVLEKEMGGFTIWAKRTGYGTEGRFLVRIFDNRQQTSVELSLSENQFMQYLEGDQTVKADRVEKWEGKKARPGKILGDTSLDIEKVSRTAYDMFSRPAQLNSSRSANSMDSAQLANKGGIDLSASKTSLEIQNAGEGIEFHLDHAILRQLQNAPGFVPVIISIQPMTNLQEFLGIQEK